MVQAPVKRPKWINIVFFILTGVGGLLGAPLYIHSNGLQGVDVFLFTFFTVASGFSITMGYHRLFAHATYKAHPVVGFLYLFFGAAAFEQSALKWASQHRYHHLYTDTDLDPYSSKKGFWYSHIGWLTAWRHTPDFSNVHDLKKNALVMNQHRFYGLWAIGAGILFPVLLGSLFHRAGGALLIAVCLRIAFVHHATFCINSVCHYMGSRTYDPKSSARDHWFVALLTFGEGYHNFHHRFPSDYRNGVRWYHWDPSKWFIALMARMGLVTGLKRAPDSKIFYARIAAEKEIVHTCLAEKIRQNPEFIRVREMIEMKYAQVQKALNKFDAAANYYRSVMNELTETKPRRVRKARSSAMRAFRAEREQFIRNYREWMNVINSSLRNVNMLQIKTPA